MIWRYGAGHQYKFDVFERLELKIGIIAVTRAFSEMQMKKCPPTSQNRCN